MPDPVRRLVPANTTGSVQHYYHFFFAVLVPLLDLAAQDSLDRVSSIASCGPMDRHLEEVSESGIARVMIEPAGSQPDLPTEALVSQELYDKHGLRSAGYSPEVLRRAAVLGSDRFGGRPLSGGVLVVSRGAPDPFYSSGASEMSGGSSSRRSVPNMAEIVEALSSDGHEVQHVELERASLRSQVRMFSGAQVVVAQHGASLANVLWMSRGSNVVEIVPRRRKRREHFSKLSAVMGVNHVTADQEDGHAAVAPELVLAPLKQFRLS